MSASRFGRSAVVVVFLVGVSLAFMVFFIPWYEDWSALGEPPWDPPHPDLSRAVTLLVPVAWLFGLPALAWMLAERLGGSPRAALSLVVPYSALLALVALGLLAHLNTCANLNFPWTGSC